MGIHALTQQEKQFRDSLNTIYGAPNPWFDSTMQAKGRCWYNTYWNGLRIMHIERG